MANGSVVGFNLGDELICHTLSYSNLSVAADTIRGAFPDALIWWNECGHTVAEPKNPAWEGQTKIPASVSWMSIDFPCERRRSDVPSEQTPRTHPHPCARRRVCDASKRQGAAMEP